MKPPQSPPVFEKLFKQFGSDFSKLLSVSHEPQYLHWDKLRHRRPPGDLSPEQWWFGIKIARLQGYRQLPMRDKAGRPFVFSLPDCVLQKLHKIDSLSAGRVALGAPVATEEQRDRFIFNSLVEEAITSSQREGASTTRQAASDMIRYRRKPRDRSERMILNNYKAMEAVRRIKNEPLEFKTLMELHRTLTEDTLNHPDAAGRIQRPGDHRVDVVDNVSHRILHMPPPADSLKTRIEKMLAFSNGNGEASPFIHPIIRSIVLHFWLAYDHPFEDGNGRTARALFYWSMLRHGYWLFEFISISRILKQAPSQYGHAFLYTETDDNDLTYFVIQQLRVIKQALDELQEYLSRKAGQLQRVEKMLRYTDLNHREIALLSHAVRHPGHRYSIRSHQTSHRVVYATARADLLHLADLELLQQRRIGQRRFEFIAPDDLEERMKVL